MVAKPLVAPLARAALLVFVFTLPFAKHGVSIAGLSATPSDAAFLITAALAAIALLRGEIIVRRSALFAILAYYLVAISLSLLVSDTFGQGAVKFASQLYLLSLPPLAYALIDDRDDLRRLLRTWLAATAVVTIIAAVTLILFFTGIDPRHIAYALHGFGTLPPGPYPRLEATFSHPAMLCNYLTVSLVILIACRDQTWIGRAPALMLAALILLSAAFTITPGLGGIALVIGIALYRHFRRTAHLLALASLSAAGIAAAAFVLAATVTPLIHPSAPFLVHLPGLDAPLAPSVRLMAWIDAARSITRAPLFGAGPSVDPIAVAYVAPSGIRHVVTDAHNVYLNVAMHIGLVGLSAILLLVWWVARQVGRIWRAPQSTGDWLAFAWLNAFAYQGLTGSYEDARHLWLLLGLMIAAYRVDRDAPVPI